MRSRMLSPFIVAKGIRMISRAPSATTTACLSMLIGAVIYSGNSDKHAPRPSSSQYTDADRVLVLFLRAQMTSDDSFFYD